MSEQKKGSREQNSNENENSALDDDISNHKVAANSDPTADASDSATDKTDSAADAHAIDNDADNKADPADSSADAADSATDKTDTTANDKSIEHDKTADLDTDSSKDKADANSDKDVKKNTANIKKKTNTTPSTDEDIDPDLPDAKPMTLMQHLGELRVKIVRSAIAIALAFVACYGVADLIFAELMKPLVHVLPEGSKLIFTSLPEAFFLELQVGFVAAIFVASPFLFYQIWSFIAPGLYDEEKKYAIPIAMISAFFFICGASFCYFVVFPFSFEYFMSFATSEIVPMPSISQYFSFTLKILIAFGIIFEMPLFTFFLSRMGLVTADAMRRVRKYAVLVIFIVAAILTPPDVISQLLMAIPMLFLYEISIYIAVIFGRKAKKEKDEDDDEEKEEKEENDKDDKKESTAKA